MTNIIVPAIITLVISITSGLMLDYYKNLAPRILCNVRNGIPMEMGSTKKCSYSITVNNSSNKTIHELTLNIQSSQSSLKSTGETITNGLKFDSLLKDNILDVYIPFLSKGDEFSVTVYLENENAVQNPVITIRSPENFKEKDSVEKEGNRSLWFNIHKSINQIISKVRQNAKVPNIKDDFTTVMSKAEGVEQTADKKDRQVLSGNKKSSKKKAMIITVSIILAMIVGISGKVYLKVTSANATAPTVKTIVPKQSTNETGSTEGTTGTTSVKKSTEGTTGTTGVKEQQTGQLELQV